MGRCYQIPVGDWKAAPTYYQKRVGASNRGRDCDPTEQQRESLSGIAFGQPHRLAPTGWRNIGDMLAMTYEDSFGGVTYGSVSFNSPRQQETTMFVGGHDELKVWLNGVLVYERLHGFHNSDDYSGFFPCDASKQGRNTLLVAVELLDGHKNGYFGFEPGTEYTVAIPGVGYTFSKTPIHTGDTFTLDISAETVFDLAGWQFDINFDPTILEAVNVTEGAFLKTDGRNHLLSERQH